MCVVSTHGCCGLDVGRDGVVVGRHARQSKGVGRLSGDAGAFPEC